MFLWNERKKKRWQVRWCEGSPKRKAPSNSKSGEWRAKQQWETNKKKTKLVK